MDQSHPSHEFTESAQTLWRAAAEFEQSASAGDTSAALPETLDYLKETLELMARGVEKASQAIEDPAQPGGDLLAPRARAVRWHLSQLSSRLLRARDAAPPTRRWAHMLLDERETVGA